MKTVYLSAISMAMLFLFSGCFMCSTGYFEAASNREKMSTLRIGMTKARVVQIMGEPLKKEVYSRPDVWFYYTQSRWTDGQCTRDECSPVVFKKGKVIGWGNDYYLRNYEFKDWDEELYSIEQLKNQNRAIDKLTGKIQKNTAVMKKNSSESRLEDILRERGKTEKDEK
jgi:outer membrane protein assembly factor BamE (lipoprotein component of BamABCDE complex)